MVVGGNGKRWTFAGITRNTLPPLLVLTVVAVVSGLVLESFESTLLSHPSLLILVPVTIGTAGNLGSLLASRMSTAFHLGTLSFEPTDDVLLGNSIATIVLALSLFPTVGVGAWLLAVFTTGTDLRLVTVVVVAVVSGAGLSVLAIAVTLVTTYGAYRSGIDPDDVVIPVVTVTCDVLGVLMLFVAVRAFVPA
ncbi:MAG: magnesium transporter [Halodesulfurarchaeum sp.]